MGPPKVEEGNITEWSSGRGGVRGFTALECVDSAQPHSIHSACFSQGLTMAKRPRIAVIGSANVDLTTFNDRFPKPGETIFGQKFDLGFGGKGANQAVAARLCGAEVFMVARVGSDLFGPATIENFRKQGIDPTHAKQVEG